MGDLAGAPTTVADVPDEGEGGGEGGLRPGVLLVAILAAVLAGIFAPAAWVEGDGEIRVLRGDEVLLSTAVRIGADEAVTLRGRIGADDLTVTFPKGVPAEGTVRALVSVEKDGTAIRPPLDVVQLEVVLSDERVELVPILGWNDEAKALKAARRTPRKVGVVLGLLALVVVLWITEVLPLWVTALMVPVVLVVGDVTTAKASLAPFFNPIIALFFGGFLMAEAMRRVRLDRLAAVTIVTWAGRSPVMLFAAVLGVSAFLSMWMSNTASTAVLLPIALAVTAPLQSRPYQKMVVLGLAYAATIGGVGSAVGTPANPIAIEFLEREGIKSISFAEWFAYGLPMVVIFVPIMGAFLWWRMGVRVDPRTFSGARWVALRQYARVRRPTGEQWAVIAVMLGVVGVWLTQRLHGLSTGIVAVAGAVTLAVIGKVKSEDLNRISWAALLTFGGGLTLGVFMVESGASDWVATRFGALSGWPPWIGVAAVAILSLVLTAVASNTATAAMLVPLAIPLAGVLGVNVVLLVVVVAIASSVDFALVIGTPPTMIAYSTRLFTAREIFRAGILLDVIGIIVLLTAVLGLWHVFGVL